MLRVELNAGQRYLFSGRTIGGAPGAWMTLRADGDQNQNLLGLNLGADSRSSVFTPETSGSYFVTLRGDNNLAELNYHIVPPDDHADGAIGATPLPIAGAWVHRQEEGGADWVSLVGVGVGDLP